MHVPIDIPSLSMPTHRDVDINKEFIAHGYSNAISFVFGWLQNFLCHCNSLLYFKCKGEGYSLLLRRTTCFSLYAACHAWLSVAACRYGSHCRSSVLSSTHGYPSMLPSWSFIWYFIWLSFIWYLSVRYLCGSDFCSADDQKSCTHQSTVVCTYFMIVSMENSE